MIWIIQCLQFFAQIEHRLQICVRNQRIACNAYHVLQYRWENLDYYKTHEGVPNHTTLRLTRSGATAPLKVLSSEMDPAESRLIR